MLATGFAFIWASRVNCSFYPHYFDSFQAGTTKPDLGNATWSQTNADVVTGFGNPFGAKAAFFKVVVASTV